MRPYAGPPTTIRDGTNPGCALTIRSSCTREGNFAARGEPDLPVEDDVLIAADSRQLIGYCGGVMGGRPRLALWLADSERHDIALLDVRLSDRAATVWRSLHRTWRALHGGERLRRGGASETPLEVPCMQEPMTRETFIGRSSTGWACAGAPLTSDRPSFSSFPAPEGRGLFRCEPLATNVNLVVL
jgi:hypothetical protein